MSHSVCVAVVDCGLSTHAQDGRSTPGTYIELTEYHSTPMGSHHFEGMHERWGGMEISGFLVLGWYTESKQLWVAPAFSGYVLERLPGCLF